MTTTAECTIDVPLVRLRSAIAAVVVHAEPTKTGDEVSALSRVRIIAGASELFVVATNLTTSALAALTIVEDSRAERFGADDGEFGVDISPGLIRDLFSTLRPRKADVDASDQLARLHFTDEYLTATDVSGLWPGSQTRKPLLPFPSDYPDVVDALAVALGGAGEAQAAKPLVANGGALALFRHAATAYDRPLQFEATGPATSRGFVVWCGPDFVGHVSSAHNDDNSLGRRDAERRKHLERLGLTATQEALDMLAGV